jgi:hypothetical protein
MKIHHDQTSTNELKSAKIVCCGVNLFVLDKFDEIGKDIRINERINRVLWFAEQEVCFSADLSFPDC